MSYLVRASDLVGRPVVATTGDLLGEVKDVVLGLEKACLIGFTLRNPGFLGGPKQATLPWENVRAVGPDAVMVDEPRSLAEPTAVPHEGSVVVDLTVITDTGDRVGTVADVIVSAGRPAKVVGFELEADPGNAHHSGRLMLPVDEMLSFSEEAIVVPDAAKRFVRDDLTGFGAAVDEYRHELEEGRRAAS